MRGFRGVWTWIWLLAAVAAVATFDARSAPVSGIRAVSGADRPRFMFANAQDELRDYEVDAWRLFKQHASVHIDLQAVAWDEANRAVLSGQADAISLLGHTPGNAAMLADISGYANTPVGSFVKRRPRDSRDVSEPPALTVGSVGDHGCTWRPARDKPLTVRLYTTIIDRVAAAARGQLAAFCIDDHAGGARLSQFGALQRFERAFLLYSGGLQAGVRKENAALRAQLDLGLASIVARERAVLRERWSQRKPPPSPRERRDHWLAIGLLGVASALLLWVRTLYRVMARRTLRLRQEEEKLRALFDASPDAVWVTNRDGRVVMHNPRLASVSTVRSPDLRGQRAGALFGPSHARLVEEAHARLITGAGAETLMFALCKSQCESVYLEVSNVAMRNAGGAVDGILSVARDVSQRMRDEGRLRLWGRSFEHAGFGIVLFDPHRQLILAANPTFARERGYLPEELEGRPADTLYPPDIRAERAAIRQKRNRTCDHWTDETEHIDREGRRFPVQLDVSVIRNEDGGPLYTLVYVHNISAQKAAERELGIAAVAFETGEAMLVTDAHRVVQRANDAFFALTGYPRNMVVGQVSDHLLRSDHHDDVFVLELWAALERTGHWTGQRWIAVAGGQSRVVRMAISSVKNQEGKVTHYVYAIADIGREHDALASVDRLTFYDQITGLPNRVFLRGRLRHLLHIGGRWPLVLFDVDQLKRINDLRDHAAGDVLLGKLARRLEAQLGPDHLLCHMGGGTFVALPSPGRPSGTLVDELAGRTTDRIRIALRDPFQLDHGAPVSVTVSMGWATINAEQGTPEVALKQAELAMYDAKARGRDRTSRFAPYMQQRFERSERLLADLRQAVADAAFELYPQGQFDRQGRRRGAEMLLRWQRADGTIASPADFIPLAESSGLILPLGRWVLATACAQLVAWKGKPQFEALTLAVNVSAKQLADPGFVDMVVSSVARSGIDPARLKLEITESAVVQDIDAAVTKLIKIREIGVCISLDDFGTGYSSLAYLARLPLDQVKIDQSFVRGIGGSPRCATIIEAIIAMGHGLGLDVIAEGVETQEQFEFLLAHGCDGFQGYLLAKPVHIDAFEQMLPPEPVSAGCSRPRLMVSRRTPSLASGVPTAARDLTAL